MRQVPNPASTARPYGVNRFTQGASGPTPTLPNSFLSAHFVRSFEIPSRALGGQLRRPARAWALLKFAPLSGCKWSRISPLVPTPHLPHSSSTASRAPLLPHSPSPHLPISPSPPIPHSPSPPLLLLLIGLLLAGCYGAPKVATPPDTQPPSALSEGLGSALTLSATGGAPGCLRWPHLQPAKGDLERWGALVEAHTDRQYLRRAFDEQGYSPPKDSFLIAAALHPGNPGLSSAWYSLGDSGFLYSYDEEGRERFWPASTIKLLAAIGALQALRALGFDGDARIQVSNENGDFDEKVAQTYEAAIVVSDNPAYNRLMEIVGLDTLNDEYLTSERGFHSLVLQRRYVRQTPTSNLRTSPQITLSQRGRVEVLPPRTFTTENPACGREGNCVTLFELLDGLRRVALHEELTEIERYDLAPRDVEGLQDALTRAPSFFKKGATAVLGEGVVILNKPGKVVGDDLVDHGLVVSPDGRRWLVALSIPYEDHFETFDAMSQALFTALLSAPRAAPLQLTGDPDAYTLTPCAGGVLIQGPAEARTEAWVNGTLTAITPEGLLPLPEATTSLVLQSTLNAEVVAWAAYIPSPTPLQVGEAPGAL